MADKLTLHPNSRRQFNRQRCPICDSIEGCDHTVNERVRALGDTEFRDRMRADDPLYQLQQSRKSLSLKPEDDAALQEQDK